MSEPFQSYIWRGTVRRPGPSPRQHTGVTDLPLTAQGEAELAQLQERLAGLTFATVLTEPPKRAVSNVRAGWLRFRGGNRA